MEPSKGPGGHYVVGTTRNDTAVAEFELLFLEIGYRDHQPLQLSNL